MSNVSKRVDSDDPMEVFPPYSIPMTKDFIQGFNQKSDLGGNMGPLKTKIDKKRYTVWDVSGTDDTGFLIPNSDYVYKSQTQSSGLYLTDRGEKYLEGIEQRPFTTRTKAMQYDYLILKTTKMYNMPAKALFYELSRDKISSKQDIDVAKNIVDHLVSLRKKGYIK